MAVGDLSSIVVSDLHTGWRGDSEEIKAESGGPRRVRASEQDQY